MLRVVATNGHAILIADGRVGASVTPDGRFLVALVGSILAQSDWSPSNGPIPAYVPKEAIEQVAAMKADLRA